MEASEDDDDYEGLQRRKQFAWHPTEGDWDDLSKVHWEWKKYQQAEDGVEIVKISWDANKMSDKDRLWLGWQGG